MDTTSNQSRNSVRKILSGEKRGMVRFSPDPAESEILIYPLCQTEHCCFNSVHQYAILYGSEKIQFPHHCRDIYGRDIIKKSPDDLGRSEDNWSFPEVSHRPLYVSPDPNKFSVLDGGCSFVKCFLEFYSWDFERINFSYLKNFAMMLFPRLEEIIRLAAKKHFDAVMFIDEFGYNKPWFPPEFFRSEVLPLYIRLASMIHRLGMYLFLHSCGEVEAFFQLLEPYVDVWHKSDWQDTEEVISHVNNRQLPIIFADLTELPLPPPPAGDLKRSAIIGLK